MPIVLANVFEPQHVLFVLLLATRTYLYVRPDYAVGRILNYIDKDNISLNACHFPIICVYMYLVCKQLLQESVILLLSRFSACLRMHLSKRKFLFQSFNPQDQIRFSEFERTTALSSLAI